MSGRLTSRMGSDKRLLLGLSAVMLVLTVAVSVLAPATAENDPRPTTYNSGPEGAKASYLLFERLGRRVSRWERPLSALSGLDAGRTTLLLAEPVYAATDEKELGAELKQFLERGGRVLATGNSGARLLPGGATKPPGLFQNRLCTTTPEGPGPLARAGEVHMADRGQWGSEAAMFHVEQRCGNDPVVVRYAVPGVNGMNGEAIWWSSATPLTNAGLKQDSDLRLLLASLGQGRDIVFDESLHGETPSLWDAAKGLPLRWLAWQAVALFVLLVLSLSRRRGPVRPPVTLPRSSPVEFARSMGELYEKGGATSAATEAARRRVLRVVARATGVAPGSLGTAPSERIAEVLHDRVGGDWTALAEHLRAAQEAQQTEISAGGALALVRALNQDAEAIETAIAPDRRRLKVKPEASEELEFAARNE